MPTTRSQTEEQEKLRVYYRECPASPSEDGMDAPNATEPPTTSEQGTSRTDGAQEARLRTNAPPVTTGAAERKKRAPSIRSHQSTASAVRRIREAELAAEEQLAHIQQGLIQKRLAAEIAAINDETDQESLCMEEPTNADQRVQDWVHRTSIRGEPDRNGTEAIREDRRDRSPAQTERRPPRADRVTFARPRSPSPQKGFERLADTLERLARHRAPPRQTQDLPIFSGAIGEWLPFKAAMTESSRLHGFTPTENLARLRTCLRGEAKQAVSALLYTASEPSRIMKTLEQCFGRPDMIINQALDEIARLPRPGSSAGELNTFAVKVQNMVAVMTCLDDRGYLRNPMLVQQVTEKLSPHLTSKWCDYAYENWDGNESEIEMLSRFLMREADRAIRYSRSIIIPQGTARSNNWRAAETRAPRAAEQRAAGAAAPRAPMPRPPYAAERRRPVPVYATTEREAKHDEVTCYCCGGSHKTVLCNKLIAMPIDKKWEWAKESRLCFVCLNSKHRRFKCQAKRCGVDECRLAHHALLHYTRNSDRDDRRDPETEDSVVAASAHIANNTQQVLLKICPITIKGKNGAEFKTYALLDEGSTITLLDKEIADFIGAHGPTRALNIHGVASSQREADSQAVVIEVKGKGRHQYHTIKARTVQGLQLGSQTIRPEALRHEHLRSLRPDDLCYTGAKPRLLIGADQWHLIVTRKLLHGRNNQPAASLTRLGWVIHGSTPRTIIASDRDTVLHIRTGHGRMTAEKDNNVHELVKSHFDIDALGISNIRKPVAKDERAVAIFESTVKRTNGRFEVGLPWKTEDATLPPSYDMAIQRLRGIERKMDKSPLFRDAYTAQVDRLLAKGYATRCRESHDNDKRLWYLPHFAVTNPNKPGKIRMVFDAAAQANGVCLNDALLDGPDMLQSLQGVLFRFREKPIAVTADIKEMFLQVKIREKDRVAQHFLWRGDDRSKPPQRMVMTSMIFGARSSPFLAHSVRNKNAKEYEESHPLAYRAITENHYMDDWVESFDSKETAIRAIREVNEVHSRAGFELAAWSSNEGELLCEIPQEARASAPKELGANTNTHEKTLGILWMSGTDELAFNTAMPRVHEHVKNGTRTPTKREALSAVMSVFDPLGLLSPYTVTAKIVLQGLWKQKIGWDEPLPPEEAALFMEWVTDLRYIADIRLPRCYDTFAHVIDRQLHVFCDASEQAYATAAYWRIEHADRSVTVILVAGKAKVAPLKAQSIPRMELQACLIGARLANAIAEGHKVRAKTVLWTDAKTALHWIRNESARYTPYVAHRLSEIADLTEIDQWRWIPSKLNVADDATRAGRTQLAQGDRWFTGPEFLYEPEEAWPIEEAPHADLSEAIVAHTTVQSRLIDVRRFSSYERLVRTTARVLLFIDKSRGRARKLEARHMKGAEQLLWREAQSESFPDEVARLRQNKIVERSSRLYKLDPKYDENGIIRLNGRINAATVPDEMKEPPILDGTHTLTRLIIRQEHENGGHVGREQLVNTLRHRFWILRLRPTVRRVLSECIKCRIKRANPATPVKGDLPQVRLSAHTRPFSRSGVDCFGPMWVTIGRRKEKRWGMIFTCLVTRAIHVELVASLSTDSAIMALRRMAARRGWPERVMSDNGTNFRGANVELANAYKQWLPALESYALRKNVQWEFIDPGAPNQGGAWERLIKSVKIALAAVLNERAPKEEVLTTALTEIEHTINSRPLTHVPVNPEDAEAITPNHFLLGSATGLPYVGECDIADKRTWKTAQALANMFWARWIREYLPTLIPRNDIRRHIPQVKTGDIVVIVDGLLPRNVWPRGVIERVHTGPDGVVRSADVRTRGGIFRRPVRRLIILPIEKRCEDLRGGEYVADRES